MGEYGGKTVKEILKSKKASVKYAKLPKGSPSWNDILQLKWEEIVKRASRREVGYKTIRKLLSDSEYDK
jgi:hypothetical protein